MSIYHSFQNHTPSVELVNVKSIYEIFPLYHMGTQQIKDGMLYMINQHFFYDPDILTYIDDYTFQLKDIQGEKVTFQWPFQSGMSYHFWYIVMRNYGKAIMNNYRKMNELWITIHKLKQKNRMLEMKLKNKKMNENEYCRVSTDSTKFSIKKIKKIGETETTNIYVGVEIPKHLDHPFDGYIMFGNHIYTNE
jgi:hypothetical protein